MRTAVIGTGTWGSAVAWLLAQAGHATVLWGRDADKVAAIRSLGRLPHLDAPLPGGLHLSADGADLAPAELVFWAVPTQYSRAVLGGLAPRLRGRPLVSLSKGLEQGSLLRLSELFAAVLGPGAYACLSGPSHAGEVVRNLPVALVAAGDADACNACVASLHGGRRRIYTSSDLVGVELGGALKNVIAIAAGVSDGLNLGHNGKAALVTRGLAEMRRLGRALGAQDATFSGLAGIGDLLTSCSSGRNHALGLALARGEVLATHLARTGLVAEGAWTSRAAVELGARASCELPIASQVASMLWDATPVPVAMDALFTRRAKDEDS